MDNMTLRVFGTLGRDIEEKFTPNGKLVGEFSVAVEQGWGDKKQTVWLDCTIWGDKNDKILLSEFAGKGTRVYLEGTPSVEAWIGKDGTAKAKLALTVRDWKVLGGWKQKETQENGAEENPY